MRTTMKVLVVGLALSALVAAHPGANAQPLATQNTVMDSRTPNQTWKLYSMNLRAGDVVRLDWFGISNMRLSIFDRLSNQPIKDLNGNPVSLTYSGTLAFGWNTMTLTMPVSASDAILVVKNPAPFSGQITFKIYTADALTAVPAPAPIVPSVNIDRRNGLDYATYQVLNGGSIPAYNVRADISYKYSGGTTPIVVLDNLLRGYTIAPSSTATDSFTMADSATGVTIQLSNVTYGEKYVVNYNFAL